MVHPSEITKTIALPATACVLLGVASVICGCAPDPKHMQTASGEPCLVTVGTQLLFVGEDACYRGFPAKSISGYLVTGLEYSAFYTRRELVPAGYDDAATWLELSPKARAKLGELIQGDSKLIELTFMGYDPKLEGAYGHFGLSRHGILADDILSARDVTDSWNKSAK